MEKMPTMQYQELPGSRKWYKNTKVIAGVLIGVVLLTILIVVVAVVATRDTESPTTPPTNPDLPGSISITRMMGHLTELQNIATNNNGSRTAKTGYNASIAYINNQLAGKGYTITIQQFNFPWFTVNTNPVFELTAPLNINYTYAKDFQNLRFGGSGSAQGSIVNVGLGCNTTDFQGFAAGSIALIARAGLTPCGIETKVNNSITAGAVGVLIYYDASSTGLFSAGLTYVPNIPTFAITRDTGEWLLGFLASNLTLAAKLTASNSVTSTPTMNLIAESTFGASPVVMMGSHLDSVPAGPGVNDDGSGSAALLELAVQYANTYTANTNKVRFAWWAAEEWGLLGSTYYVSQMTTNDVALYLNYDMLGSPNYIRGVYNGTGAAAPIQAKCEKIQALYQSYFTSKNLPTILTPFNGRSDYGPFIAKNIPAGGLFTGADGSKSPAERTLFGGIANIPYDTCYHQACDTTDNIDQTILLENGQAMGYALQVLAAADLSTWW